MTAVAASLVQRSIAGFELGAASWRTHDAYTLRMGRDSRVYVKASSDEQHVFRAVAAALGQADNMSAAIRSVMFEKARELGLIKPAASRRTGHKSPAEGAGPSGAPTPSSHGRNRRNRLSMTDVARGAAPISKLGRPVKGSLVWTKKAGPRASRRRWTASAFAFSASSRPRTGRRRSSSSSVCWPQNPLPCPRPYRSRRSNRRQSEFTGAA